MLNQELESQAPIVRPQKEVSQYSETEMEDSNVNWMVRTTIVVFLSAVIGTYAILFVLGEHCIWFHVLQCTCD